MTIAYAEWSRLDEPFAPIDPASDRRTVSISMSTLRGMRPGDAERLLRGIASMLSRAARAGSAIERICFFGFDSEEALRNDRVSFEIVWRAPTS